MKKIIFLILLFIMASCLPPDTVAPQGYKLKVYLKDGKNSIICDKVLQLHFAKEHSPKFRLYTNGHVIALYDTPSKIDTIRFEGTEEVKIDSSLYYEGYKRGQIDATNNHWKYKRVTTDDGEVIFQKIK